MADAGSVMSGVTDMVDSSADNISAAITASMQQSTDKANLALDTRRLKMDETTQRIKDMILQMQAGGMRDQQQWQRGLRDAMGRGANVPGSMSGGQ